MRGAKLIHSLSRKLAAGGKVPLTRKQLAAKVGLSAQVLWHWKQPGENLTIRQVTNLVAAAMKSARQAAEKEAIKPIVEFFNLDAAASVQGVRQELYSPKVARDHPYLGGLKNELETRRGIYVFYDSRGRALYVGKTRKQYLWAELKNAFNRSREIQKIKRVRHPHNRTRFRTSEEKTRQIAAETVALHHLAAYVSAYAVPDGLINSLEALLVRGFANDLLNIRMERFAVRPSKKRKRRRRIRRG